MAPKMIEVPEPQREMFLANARDVYVNGRVYSFDDQVEITRFAWNISNAEDPHWWECVGIVVGMHMRKLKDTVNAKNQEG